MSLTNNSAANSALLIDEITAKLKMVNVDALKTIAVSDEQYLDLKDIHHMVMKKTSFSPNEMEAIVEELGKLRQ